MPDYKYQGTSRSGSSVSGVMTASNKTELASLLKRQQITATKMTEKGKEFSVPSVGGGVITLLLWKVVPIFATLFAGLGVDLPLPTKIVIAMSNFIGSIFGLLLLVAIVGALFGLKVWYGTQQGRFILDTIVLKLPIVGILMRKIAVARFTRTLGTLISSGVPILEGLDITAKTAGNAV